jgi:predicted homoserine dehydrogenase-like protein
MPSQFLQAALRETKARIGIVGTGFIAAGLCLVLKNSPDMVVCRVLTRRTLGQVSNIDAQLLSSSMEELVEHSDIIVECSGDIFHASEVIHAAQDHGLPVVTMGSEFHVTVGSYFSERGPISEAEGDQPGSLAALGEEALEMGFKPLVYGNIKGYLNHHPDEKEMELWAGRNGISRAQVTSFTDGTKLQIEQALVANGLGASILKQGMAGPENLTLEEAGALLGAEAAALGKPISDYVLNRQLPAGVFVVCEHPVERPEVLRYLKLGAGPYYTLLRPYHLCHLEMPRTIRRMLAGRAPLLNNSAEPRINVAAIAKQDLSAGHVISTAIGGVDLRGEAVTFAEMPDAPPIGLLTGARLRHSVSKGQPLQLSDVDIPDSLAKKAWEAVHSRLLIPV